MRLPFPHHSWLAPHHGGVFCLGIACGDEAVLVALAVLAELVILAVLVVLAS